MLNSVHSETVVEAMEHLTGVLKMTEPRDKWMEDVLFLACLVIFF